MDLKLDQDAMQALVAKTIFESLTPEKREEILKSAIAYLAMPQEAGSGYGSRRRDSPLEAAFKTAAEYVTTRIVTEQLKEDADFTAKVKAVMLEAVERAFNIDGGGREKMVQAISDAIVAGLRPKESY